MSKSESDYKTEFVKAIIKQGGWARRLEDKFAVGVLDMVIVVPGLPVFFAEGKVVNDGTFFEPTPRQFVEMRRIDATKSGAAQSVLIGFGPDRVSFSPTVERAYMNSPSTFHCSRAVPESRMLYNYYTWRYDHG